MYLARHTSIDFVAHHEIQFQSCRGIYETLSGIHRCNALIGQQSKSSGAEVAILLDHSGYQSMVTKKNYRYLIHMSHDLADWEIYSAEKGRLSEFDLILVPGPTHRQKAHKSLGSIPIFEVGWPKLDGQDRSTRAVRPNESSKITIIYAPTCIDNREWTILLPELIATQHHILVKNHLIYDFEGGALPPSGSEQEYKNHIDSLIEMEAYLNTVDALNVEYVNRRSNLCDLFCKGDVLITDSSSSSLEFLSFGLSIETGRFGKNRNDTKPSCSLASDRVKYFPIDNLVDLLRSNDIFVEMINAGANDARERGNPFIFDAPNGSVKYAASLIDLFLYLKQQGA